MKVTEILSDMEFCLSVLGCGGEEAARKMRFDDADDNEQEYYPFIPRFKSENREAIELARNTGNEYYHKGNNRKAIEEYSKGIRLFDAPEGSSDCVFAGLEESAGSSLLSQLLANRANAYSNIGEFDNCIYDARAVIKLRPQWVNGHFLKGEGMFGLRYFNKAIESYEKALEAVN
jgi:tetratricopeptide (TPR) repeat protein